MNCSRLALGLVMVVVAGAGCAGHASTTRADLVLERSAAPGVRYPPPRCPHGRLVGGGAILERYFADPRSAVQDTVGNPPSGIVLRSGTYAAVAASSTVRVYADDLRDPGSIVAVQRDVRGWHVSGLLSCSQ